MAIGRPVSLTSNIASKVVSVVSTAGQTVYTVSGGYTINQLSVFRNGIRLSQGKDYTASDGSTVTLLSAANAVDNIEFEVFDSFQVADAITSSGTDQVLSSNLDVQGNLTAVTHIGNVTGTAATFTTITVNDQISGNITGTAATFTTGTFSGPVSVGGTLTYEDATNVDSVGLVTARTGVRVTENGLIVNAGVSTFAAAIDLNAELDVDGQTDLDNLIVAGVSTFAADVSIADKIIHTGDTNTAIRFPAADTITAETGGTERLRITSDGSVGIGTTNPNYRLVVAEQDNAVMIREGAGTLAGMTTNTSQKLWFQGGNAELGLFRDSNGSYEYILGTWQSSTPIPLVFRTGNRAERLRITSAGSVGIGTTNPQAKLHVSDGANGLEFNPNSQNAIVSYNRVTSAYTPVGLQGSTVSLRIGGVGTALQVDSSGDVSLTENLLIPEDKKIHLEGSSGDDLNAIWKADTENTVFVTSRYNIANIIDSNNDDTESFWSVRHNATTLSASSELMRVQSDGKIGIGLTNPGTTLHIKSTDASSITQILDTGNAQVSLVLRNSTSTGNNIQLNANGNDFRILTNASERLCIDSNGNMGLGTTTPNNYNNYSTFTLNNTTGGEIDFEVNGTLIADIFANAGGLFFNTRVDDDAIVFSTHNGSSLGERLRIKDDGIIQFTPAGATSSANASFDTSGDNFRINTKKDGSDGIGLIFQAQASGGSMAERLRINSVGGVNLGGGSCIAAEATSGDFSINIAGLRQVVGSVWRQASILVYYVGLDGGASNSNVFLSSIRLRGLHTWSNVATTNITGTASVALSNDSQTGCTLSFDVADGNSGSVIAVLNGGSGDSTFNSSLVING